MNNKTETTSLTFTCPEGCEEHDDVGVPTHPCEVFTTSQLKKAGLKDICLCDNPETCPRCRAERQTRFLRPGGIVRNQPNEEFMTMEHVPNCHRVNGGRVRLPLTKYQVWVIKTMLEDALYDPSTCEVCGKLYRWTIDRLM
jgi:hypothetical protein